MLAALFIEHLVEKAIDRLYPEKEHPDSLSEVRVQATNISPVK